MKAIPKILSINILLFLFILHRHIKVWFPNDIFLSNILSEYAIVGTSAGVLISLFIFFISKRKIWFIISIVLISANLYLNPVLIQPPYFYHLIIFVLFSSGNKNNYNIFLTTMLVYSIAGFQKINPFFFEQVLPFYLPGSTNFSILLIGLTIILLEILIPFFYLKNPHSKIVKYLFLGLNAGIMLVALIDQNIDYSVILWIITLVINAELSKTRKRQHNNTKFIIIPLVLLALLGYIGLINPYLSFKIYSGNTNLAIIKNHKKNDMIIEKWFFDRYHLYPPQQSKFYKLIFYSHCKKNPEKLLKLTILHKEKWLIKKNKKTIKYC